MRQEVPPRPRAARPQHTRPLVTRQPAAEEAEASELTALLRAGSFEILVRRTSSEPIDDRSIERGAACGGAPPRPVSAPARERVPAHPSSAPTRERRVASWHNQTAWADPRRAERTVSSTATSAAYERPPPSPRPERLATAYADSDEESSDMSEIETDSVLADDELTDVPRTLSAPDVAGRTCSRSRSSSSRSSGLSRSRSRSSSRRHGASGAWPLEEHLGNRGLLSRPSSAASSANSRRPYRERERERLRTESAGSKKTKATRQWVASHDQENHRPQPQAALSKPPPPPRPRGPPPSRSSSSIRRSAAAETGVRTEIAATEKSATWKWSERQKEDRVTDWHSQSL